MIENNTFQPRANASLSADFSIPRFRTPSSKLISELFGWPFIPVVRGAIDTLEGKNENESAFRKCKDGSYILHIEVPGIKAKDLDVEYKDGGIAVKGQSAAAEDNESYSNSIEAFYLLPEDAETEAIKANLADGVLTFRVPCKAPAAPAAKKITIE